MVDQVHVAVPGILEESLWIQIEDKEPILLQLHLECFVPILDLHLPLHPVFHKSLSTDPNECLIREAILENVSTKVKKKSKRGKNDWVQEKRNVDVSKRHAKRSQMWFFAHYLLDFGNVSLGMTHSRSFTFSHSDTLPVCSLNYSLSDKHL